MLARFSRAASSDTLILQTLPLILSVAPAPASTSCPSRRALPPRRRLQSRHQRPVPHHLESRGRANHGCPSPAGLVKPQRPIRHRHRPHLPPRSSNISTSCSLPIASSPFNSPPTGSPRCTSHRAIVTSTWQLWLSLTPHLRLYHSGRILPQSSPALHPASTRSFEDFPPPRSHSRPLRARPKW